MRTSSMYSKGCKTETVQKLPRTKVHLPTNEKHVMAEKFASALTEHLGARPYALGS